MAVIPTSISGTLVYSFANLELLNEALTWLEASPLFTNIEVDTSALQITAHYLQTA